MLGGIFVMNDQQWDEFLFEVDLNKNGVIEFDEFKIMMQNLSNNKGDKLLPSLT